MSDTKDDKTNDQNREGRTPLTLKPRVGGNVSTGTVKQSFSHGRSKTVVVETKRRIGTPPAGAPGAPARPSHDTNLARPAPAAPNAPRPQSSAPQQQRPSGPGGLRQEEQDARQRAIQAALAEQQRRDAEAQAAAARAAAQAAAAQAAARPEPVAEAPKPVVETAPAPQAAAPQPAPQAAPAVPQAREAAPQRDNPPQFRNERAPRYDQRAPREGYQARDGQRDGQRSEGRPSYPPRDGQREGQRDGQRSDFRPRDGQPARDGQRSDGRPSYPPRDGNRDGPRSDSRPPRDPNRPYTPRDPNAPRPPRDPNRPYTPRDPNAPRPPREGGERSETVRYSANSPRPPRMGGGGVSANAPATPEVDRIRSSRGTAGPVKTTRDDDDRGGRGPAGSRSKAGAPVKAVSQTRGEPKRREGRLTLQAVVGDDEGAADRMRSLASVRRAREREREKRKGSQVEQARVSREVVIPDVITVQELSNRMAVRAVDIIKMLMKQGMMLKINDVIDTDTAELVASEFGHTVKRVSESDVEEGFISAADDEGDTVPRPPVVAVMGHVDHGKTSLLDALRKTDTAAGEAGGITQHIGAYQVRVPSGEKVTFLDTPGHAAFSAMRARGANVTDIVVLVVAADDGVMPQTVEAINHARAAKTPIIVAVNKIDKPGAKPQNIINELLQHEIVVESLGGETQVVEVSAKTGQGLDSLIEAILLQSEVLDLRANPDRTAEGVVIEAKLDKGRGPVATVLVKRGTLKRGDIVVAGSSFGRVRALINERNEQLPEAGPSEPVEILGLDEAPSPGDAFAVVENEARAREITDYRERVRREKTLAPVGAVSLTDMMSKLADKKVKELQLIIKADVQGSAEAIIGSLEKVGNEEVRARIIHSGAGAITESDVQLAKGSNSPIIGFNVRASKQARDLAEREGVEIRYYAIIYDLIDDIKGVLSGMLAPIQRETFLGNAEVLEVFDITKVGKVAGCRVTEGRVEKGARVRILRDNVVIQEMGVLSTLKRFKDEVNSVVVGQECGMAFNGFQDLKPGDFIECFTVEEIKRTL
ncbi:MULTISPECIES: translation initiation factor IF-2 [Asticcacaulis]|uniref:translation initiation factor IF-2 n=1 Tax=Asticcacaulis TaxID=76890 RepID=UPI001AE48F75|nr:MULTISPECIES: translation initiation factor IF-2 [Asticcacaulis]MBP2159869.1 translation initiation factor IF-2 [Asticcacaulis solisilvae]MDR6800914.1 translation initiation factor IF-2 [Asticcacaulis sp. BE141]